MSARLLDQCEICGNRDLRSILNLGLSPPTCAIVPVGSPRAVEEHHPLELLYCSVCQLGMLSVVVSNDVSFPPDYPYSSGNSRALHENFEDLAAEVEVHLRASGQSGFAWSDDLVVDVGANDGTLLSKFDHCRKVAVEPTAQVFKVQAPPESVYGEFFTENLAGRIRGVHGQAKIITACNVLAHVDHLSDVMRGIQHLLADDGVLVVENHDLASVIDGRQWDTVYHEHLRYFSPYSFSMLLRRYGLGVQDWKYIPTHGGSFRMFARRGQSTEWPASRTYDFDGLARDAKNTRTQLRSVLGYGNVGIGATARATTIINYCGLDVEDVKYVCEVSGSDKIGHYIPGTRIPVVDESVLFEERPALAVLFSWHLADHIVPKLRERGFLDSVVVPLPRVRYLLDGANYGPVLA